MKNKITKETKTTMNKELLRKESETKKEHNKRISILTKPFNCYTVKGDNDSAKVDRNVILKVSSSVVKISDKLTIFNTVSPKVANKEVLKVLKYLLDNYSVFEKEIQKELLSYKYRGYKLVTVGSYAIEILSEKL